MQKATRRSLFKAAAGVWAVLLAVSVAGRANQDLTDKPAVPDATVNFGAAPPQPAPPGNPANHDLVPNEVTIFRGGTVTFIANGGGHGIAIYPVSKNTARAHIEEDLCQGGPVVCNPSTGTANQRYLITDGDGNLIIDSGVNPPENRVN